SEADQDLSRPHTTAIPASRGDGWLINGRKVFSTMSPVADYLTVSVTYQASDGGERYGVVRVPAAAPGVVVNDDWDALGMRASASGSVTYRDVHVPATALRDGFPAGRWSAGLLDRFLVFGAMHASASLGIAEAAHEQSVAYASGKRRDCDGPRLSEKPMSQVLAAENVIDITAMRATFDRAGGLIDAFYAEHPASIGSEEELHGIFCEVQSAKTFIHQAAIRVVDRALTLSGGAGYMNRHPLSRHCRDVRAGPFMHPLGLTAAYEYIGRLTLGLEPAVN